MSLLDQALDFSKEYHKDHTRLTGEAVHDHCLRVVRLLQDEGINDEKVLIIAALHHVPKYDPASDVWQKLEQLFGKDVASSLMEYYELTKRSIKRVTSKDIQNQYIIPSFLNLTTNVDIIAIRIADKLDNLNTCFNFQLEIRNRLADRALVVYAPIARFIHLTGFLNKLEDQAFKILYPADHFRITSFLKTIERDATLLFEDIKRFMSELCSEHMIKHQIDFRIKKPYSIFKKERRYIAKGISPVQDFTHLPDILAMRLLVETVDQCYLVDSLLKNVWTQIPEYTEDLIVNPRPSGYQSLHSVFKATHRFSIEIQIKTFAMHEVNEYGVASHIFYKASSSFKKKLLSDPDWVKKLNYWEKDYTFNSHLTGEKPFSNKIYTFTPKGDVIELDRGATVIDFAYAVHEDLGRNFIGGLVNASIAKASQVLNDGDVVEIKASKRMKLPSRDWLDFVKTSKARAHIKKELKE